MRTLSRDLVLSIAIAAFALVPFPADAQSPGYTKLDIRGRVKLELPSDWTISDSEQRKQVKELAEKLMGATGDLHVAALAAQSYPAPSRVLVRVSFLKLDPPITQAELKRVVQANRAELLSDLAASWEADAPSMWASFAKRGVKEVGRPSYALGTLGGQTAMIIRYTRTVPGNAAKTMRVSQFHIPLGAEKALISLTYLDGDKAAKAAHDRVAASFVIR